MALKLKPLRDQVMVITGASSGIGLATARLADEAGARLVLAARSHEVLEELEQQFNAYGGEAVHVVADVGRLEDVERIAQQAVLHFGGFDTWVNNAGVSIWGRADQPSEDENRRLFDTNFWGVVNGSLVAAKHLRHRGGAIINLGSVASELSLPLQVMYSASKHAVEGFTDGLRLELEDEGAPISVTLIKPTSIDTPFTEHARNFTDREPQLPPPVYPPEEVARAILHAAEHPVRDVPVGGASRFMSAIAHQSPRLMDWFNERVMSRQVVRDEPPRNPEGALFRPSEDGRIHGDRSSHVTSSSFYNRAARHPLITGALVAVAGAAAAAMIRSGRSHDGSQEPAPEPLEMTETITTSYPGTCDVP